MFTEARYFLSPWSPIMNIPIPERERLLASLEQELRRPQREQFFLESDLPHYEVILDGNNDQTRSESPRQRPAHDPTASAQECDQPTSPE